MEQKELPHVKIESGQLLFNELQLGDHRVDPQERFPVY